jgi:hypothetical protein
VDTDCDIVSAKQKRSAASLNLPETYFTCEPYGGGTTVLLSRGLVRFVALRCYAEEYAFSLSTQAQDHVWDLAEYKGVEPAHCPTGTTSGGTGYERNLLWAYHPLCLRTRLVLCMTGVLKLDMT